MATLIHQFAKTAQSLPQTPAYYFKHDNQWKATNWTDYLTNTQQVARSFLKYGLSIGSTICIFSNTRPEWSVAFLGGISVGLVPAGIYMNSSTDEAAYIVNHCEASVLFIETYDLYKSTLYNHSSLPTLKKVVVIEGTVPSNNKNVVTWQDFLNDGKDIPLKAFHERLNSIKAEALACLIYTSGTTGPPKGVMLSHKNLVETAYATVKLLNVTSNDISVAFLPLSHVAEQILTIYLNVFVGTKVYYSEGLLKVAQNLAEVQPTIFFAPPRFWEKFCSALQSKIPKGVKPVDVPAPMKAAFRKAIGLGQLRMGIVGAAPSSPTVLQFFTDIGLPIHEVYGQSESSGVSTFTNTPKIGSIGHPAFHLQIKLDEEDQILVKGPTVFMGYYKDPKSTAETLIDGWLQSGDLGKFNEDGSMSIIGRKKDILITSGGENIAAPKIEKQIESTGLVQNAVIVGDSRHFLAALISVDADSLALLQSRLGSNTPLTPSSPEVKKAIGDTIQQINQTLSRAANIRKFLILPQPFSVESGELTPTMKMKRAFVYRKFKNEIDSLYAQEPTQAKL